MIDRSPQLQHWLDEARPPRDHQFGVSRIPPSKRSIVRPALFAFLRESLELDGLDRDPVLAELTVSEVFLTGKCDLSSLSIVQSVYSPGLPLRDREGMDPAVSGLKVPKGGRTIATRTIKILEESGEN